MHSGEINKGSCWYLLKYFATLKWGTIKTLFYGQITAVSGRKKKNGFAYYGSLRGQ